MATLQLLASLAIKDAAQFILCHFACYFLSVFSYFTGIIRDSPELSGNSYPLKFKFISGPAAENEAPRGKELGFMDARINQYKFEFNMSGIQHMTSFIEDEKITTPTPMHVSVADLTVILKVILNFLVSRNQTKICIFKISKNISSKLLYTCIEKRANSLDPHYEPHLLDLACLQI